MLKLLVDECLSPELVKLARSNGHPEATHVTWLGHRGRQDWNLIKVIVEGDYTFVTANSYDFRGPARTPGLSGHHAHVELHCGLICLTALRMDIHLQHELFEVALRELEADCDLVNLALEVMIEGDHIVARKYPIPRSGPYAR